MTVCAVVIAMAIAAAFGVKAIRDIGNYNAEQTLLLLCETGNKDLDYFFSERGIVGKNGCGLCPIRSGRGG